MTLEIALGLVQAAETVLAGVGKIRADLNSDDQAVLDERLAATHGKLTTDLARVIAKADAAAKR